jgi:hypothetical protein
MNASRGQEFAEGIAAVLGHFRRKGVRLWPENGQLRYKAPKGTLTAGEIERLRASRVEIVAHLEKVTAAQALEPRLEPRPQSNRAPLAFSQLAHWHLYQLGKRRAIRQVACAVHLQGRLSADVVRKSVAEVVRRHDALRTRIVFCDGIHTQEIDKSVEYELAVVDLTTLSESARKIEVNRQIENLILEPLDVTVGPLFGVRLLRLCDDEHLLVIAMEHMISDAVSMNILLRDLFKAYAQTASGHVVSLPEIPIQFADYALWQVNGQRAWMERHGGYWSRRLWGCKRVEFPVDKALPAESADGWQTVPLRIGGELTAKLREWCRVRQTTLVMSVFVAYVALVLRWCGVSDAVIQYQSDGRNDSKIENAIGYFATVLYLRIEIQEADNFVDLLNRTTREYCNAYEHADLSYLEAQVPRPEFARNSAFNWVPGASEIDLSGLAESVDALRCTTYPFPHPMLKTLMRDNEPMVELRDTEDGISGEVYFPRNRFHISTMERFARSFLAAVRALLERPEQRIKDISLL